jgi:hypothetical protein
MAISGGVMIKILFLAANPKGTPPLALDKELRAIDAKIRSAEYRKRLKMSQHWAVRLDDLSGLLMRERPEVVHFSGHGSKSGQIVLLADDDTPKPVPAQALAERFRVLKDNVRIVVLNACYAEPQAKGIARVIDCTIGMSDKIRDNDAIGFAAAFYEALAHGRSVQDAFDLGVARLLDEGVAKGLARLHKRMGVNPAEITLIERSPKSTKKPAFPARKPSFYDLLDQEPAVSGLQSLVYEVLDQRKSAGESQREKWKQVADYFDTLAATVDEAVEGFRAGRPAYAGYWQLKEMLADFDRVIRQIYQKSDPEGSERVEKMRYAIRKALHLFLKGDAGTPEIIAIIENRLPSPKRAAPRSGGFAKESDRSISAKVRARMEAKKNQVLGDLEVAAGRFRGVAASLRARA